VKRILWNRRPTSPADLGDIDEIVIHDPLLVHIEQMDDRCWWIGIESPEGGWWAGVFSATSRGVMTFGQQENDGVTWDKDDTQESRP